MIHVVLTVRDQREEVIALLEDLGALDPGARLLVIDDGSSDGTPEVVAGHPGLGDRLSLIQHVRRHGSGQALMVGLRRVISGASPGDLVLTLPPGSAPDLDSLRGVLRLLEQGMDVVVGSRRGSGGSGSGRGGWQAFWEALLTGVLRLLLPLPGILDSTSGFRGYRLSALERAFGLHGRNLVTFSGGAGQVELLIRLARMGARMAETPWGEEPGAKASSGEGFSLAELAEYARMILALAWPGRGSAGARG